MVKLFQSTHEFKHPWSNVTAAFWRKYPNDLSPHVKEVDTYHRSLHNGRLYIHRLIRVESSVPQWLTALNVPTSCYATECTIVDPKERSMTIRSRNLTGSNMMVVEEECVYKPAATNMNHTTYTQSASITAFLPVFSSQFEQYSLTSMHQKAKLGLHTMEQLCDKVKQEGIGSLVDQLAKLIKDDDQKTPNTSNLLTLTAVTTSSSSSSVDVAGVTAVPKTTKF